MYVNTYISIYSTIWGFLILTTTLMLLCRLYTRIYLRFGILHVFSSCRNFRHVLPEIFMIIAWLSFVALMSSLLAINLLYRKIIDDANIEDEDITPSFSDLASSSRFSLQLHDDFQIYYKYHALGMFIYFLCVYSIKGAIWCSYAEVFPSSMRKTWILLRILAGAMIVFIIYDVVSLLALYCKPLSTLWTFIGKNSLEPKCDLMGPKNIILVAVTNGLPHLVTDLILYILPFTLLRRPDFRHGISKSKLTGFIIMFSIGFFSLFSAFIILPLNFIKSDTKDRFYFILRNLLLMFELWTAFLACCVPATRSVLINLWRKMGSKSTNERSETCNGDLVSIEDGVKEITDFA